MIWTKYEEAVFFFSGQRQFYRFKMQYVKMLMRVHLFRANTGYICKLSKQPFLNCYRLLIQQNYARSFTGKQLAELSILSKINSANGLSVHNLFNAGSDADIGQIYEKQQLISCFCGMKCWGSVPVTVPGWWSFQPRGLVKWASQGLLFRQNRWDRKW